MQSVNSQALGLTNRALGITGQPSRRTQFLDGELVQVFDVAAVARRSQTPADSEGVFSAVMRNVHGAADTISTTVDPFNVTTGRIGAYPGPVGRNFDVWLLGASVARVSGAGTLLARLMLRTNDATQGWGIDDQGVAIADAPTFPIGFWDSVESTFGFGLRDGANPYIPLGIRMVRGQNLQYTSVSSAVETDQAQLTLGVYPVTLGQDALSR